MEWTKYLSVGVAAIDDQHKELIKRANLFFDALNQDADNHKVLEVLDFLWSYIQSHFKDEENLQVKVNYSKYPQHKKIHDDFVNTVKKIRKDIA